MCEIRQGQIGFGGRSASEHLVEPVPSDADRLHATALSLAEAGDYERAAALLEHAFLSGEALPTWYRDLAIVYLARGEARKAAEWFVQALDRLPDDPDALMGYGQALLAMGEAVPAAVSYQKAIAQAPDDCEPLHGLARALLLQGRHDEAADVCRQSLLLDAGDADSHRLQGEIYFSRGNHEAARQAFETALELLPGDPESHARLTSICWALGDQEGTLAHCRALVESGRATPALHSFYLYQLLYERSETPASIRHACETFGRSLAPGGRTPWPAVAGENPERRLRVGYLTGEFIRGSAFYFLSSLIGNHDTDAVEVFLYHTRSKFDRITEWYQGRGHWRDCRDLDNTAIADRIRADAIDVAVDFSGFFPDNKLDLFAQRVAPVQVTYPNCPITTGVPNIDYILTDRWTCPKGSEDQYSEEAVYLPSGYLAYSVPIDAPPPVPLPAIENGFITFGLFQRRPKLNAAVWDAVAAVLRRSPGSRLLMQSADSSLDDPESRARRAITGEFSRRGVEPHRLGFVGRRGHREALSVMAQSDIALDTFPYQGQTTTCDCLWMGVPVVAWSGATHVSRVGSAILQRVGLDRLVANTADDYARIAIDLAQDVSGLASLRSGMRDRLRASTLLDGRNLAGEVEAAYRQMWRCWCIGQKT
jgi:predicted O-linked N-acetylglucosamine transferase (SPINDLY family)